MDKAGHEQVEEHAKGVLGADYHIDRLKSPGPRYRFKRRGWEAARIIQTYGPHQPRILDVGTADGLLLDIVCNIVTPSFAAGIDLSWGLLKANSRKYPIAQADAEKLPFDSGNFDAVIATAIIEHVPHPGSFVDEIHRVLKPAGVCILTTPDPFFDEIASTLGFLKEEDHQETFNLKRLRTLVADHHFEILEAEKFMMSPIGFPAEQTIEKIMKRIGLGGVLLNQLVAARKRVNS